MKISKAADGDFRHVPRFRFFSKAARRILILGLAQKTFL